MIQCLVGVLNELLPPLDHSCSHVDLLCQPYELRAQEASKTPALPRGLQNTGTEESSSYDCQRGGREQAGLRTQHQARAVMGAASGGLVAHLRNGLEEWAGEGA